MTIESGIRVMAGAMVLISLGLSFLSPYWLLLAAFVGVNLVQSAFTGFCPAVKILKKMGLKEGEANELPTSNTEHPTSK